MTWKTYTILLTVTVECREVENLFILKRKLFFKIQKINGLISELIELKVRMKTFLKKLIGNIKTILFCGIVSAMVTLYVRFGVGPCKTTLI